MRSAIALAVAAGCACIDPGSARAQPCDAVAQWNGDGPGDLIFEPPWPIGADLNGDWSLDAYDVLEMVIDFGPCDETCPGDLDGSLTVDLIDLLMLMAEIEPSPFLARAGG